MSKIVAVIDIGSNSARMAVFSRSSRFGFSLICESKSKVRISEGSYENNGYLQAIPMKRALNALKDFMLIAKSYGARKILCVATSALRDAPNKSEFISKVRSEIGINIKVIDGKKEAFYGAVACSNLLHKKNGITLDIGGGSSECAIIENGKIIDLISLDIGTIRIKEKFFDTNHDISEARAFIKKELKKLPQSFSNSTIFGIGGTIRALSKLILKKDECLLNTLHGFEFDVQKQMKFFNKICDSNIDELRKIGVPSDREDNIRSGALIFLMFLEEMKAKIVVTSGVGVREGVFLSDLLRNHNYLFPTNFNPSIRSLRDRFISNKSKQNVIKKNALKLFNLLQFSLGLKESYLTYLKCAASLSQVGDYLGFYSSHEYSNYFITNALSYGFSHNDRVIIGLLVKYIGKKLPKQEELIGVLDDVESLQWISFILSVAELLSIYNIVFDFDFKNRVLFIKQPCNIEVFIAKDKIKSLSTPKKIDIEFI